MVVISVSLSGQELKAFDQVIESAGYDSRSSAVRDALYKFIADRQLNLSGHTHVALTLVYEPEQGQSDVSDVAHAFEDVITTSLHHHLEKTCVDVFIIHGEGSRVKQLLESLAKVKDVRVTMTAL
ncbi:MAG: CopG family ribbon-helix-helix protein [Thermoplasmatota archaeon]